MTERSQRELKRQMIDLSQYEVWFVTGSQHLYGPETLEHVAEHSAGIAQELDRAEEMGSGWCSSGADRTRRDTAGCA